MLALAIAAIALPGAQTPATPPNQFLVAEVVAELNGMVDKYRKIPSTSLGQNYKELKVRKVNLVSVDAQFLYSKIDVRVREINGATGWVISTKDGSARGKFRWGPVTAERACLTAGLQEFSCLNVTSIANVSGISGQEGDPARRAIMANFPREVCALMWPTLRVQGTVAPEKTHVQSRSPGLRPNKLRFLVILSNYSARNVKVKYGTKDGTAKAGLDYQAMTGELFIPDGKKSMEIEVPIIPRDGNQGSRMMHLEIWSPVNAKIVGNRANGVIVDTGQTVPSGAIPPPN